MSNRLKELRIAKGKKDNRKYSQEDIAKLLKIGQTTLSQYEKGTRNMNETVLKIFADFYECSTDYILGLSDKLTEELDDIQVAFNGAVSELTEEDKKDVLKFIKFIKSNKE